MATEQTLDTINNANLKTVGESGAWSIAQKAMNDVSHASRIDKIAEVALSNLVAHQGRMQQLSEMVIGKFGENATSVDPLEAVAVGKTLRSESDAANASILAGLAAGRQSLNSASADNFATFNAMNHTNQATNAAMLAIAQVLAKVAQTTPPQTDK
jgi:hypothetical protein